MLTDSEIIRRAEHEPAAFTELFERHARVVAGYAAGRVGIDAADDIVSETFLTAFRRRGSFREDAESARPWLLGIATRVIRSHRKIEARYLRNLGAAAEVERTTRPDPADSVSARLDADAELRALAPRVAALSQRDRDTLYLFAVAQLSHEEIAAALSVPIGTVKSRLNRVRRLLALEDDNDPPALASNRVRLAGSEGE